MFNDFEAKLSPDANWELKYIHVFNGIFIAATENEYKKGNKIALDGENDYSIEEKTVEDYNYFALNIKSKTYSVQIRSNSRISLEYIIFHATLKDRKDIGRPLTFYPHLSNIESPLEEKRLNENNYKGFINLIILALVLSHLRLMWENYIKYGLILTPKNVFNFLFTDNNFIFPAYSLAHMLFAILFTFGVEKIRSKSAYNPLHLIFHIINLGALLIVPLLFHKLRLINAFAGISALSLITVVFLKLYSYIHFWNDVRLFIKNKTRLIKTDSQSQKLQENVYKEIEEVIENYPDNVIISDLFLFLAMPTLCFQYKYPRTQRTRKRYVITYALQFLISALLQIFIGAQYMLPTVQNSLKFIVNDDYLNIVERVLKLAIPLVYAWILMFFCIFHSWLNLLAELTRYGDRTFYKDWWNSLYLDEYWRTWNLPTHFWLMRHIYNPLRRRHIDKMTCSAIVFFVSAVFHEYIISGALGFTSYWAFIAMFANFPISVIQEMFKKSKFFNTQSQLLNVQFWIAFCFFGQPLCVIIYFYNYYKQNEIMVHL